ncbi:hypothetical protein PITC_012710 [Penicillium italicum]|uniref:Uncharacterized protein n=1 Tax=Penicillium italicum TaxID=40296 RepID=A0A0A2K884_PENIT|nr:hypothetical protein PITC_012710 [Penicillium italicum]
MLPFGSVPPHFAHRFIHFFRSFFPVSRSCPLTSLDFISFFSHSPILLLLIPSLFFQSHLSSTLYLLFILSLLRPLHLLPFRLTSVFPQVVEASCVLLT